MNFVSEVGFITEMGWAHQTSYTPTLLIEVAVISMESKNSLICVLGISILPLPTMLSGFWNCFDSVVFFVFHFMGK